MAYKRDNMIYGSLDNSYVDSMDESVDNNQDALRWKLLADQAMKDDSSNSTNEGDAYRQKELLAVRARKKKIVQEIDELKKELQQRTQLQAYEDRYKDSPIWKLAKKQYIDTGDLSPIESFVTRENALEEAMKTRDFTGRENELNRKNTLELNKAQKSEQYEYNYDEAVKELGTAEWILKYNMRHNPSEVPDSLAKYKASLSKANDLGKKINEAEIEPMDLSALDNYDEWSENHDVNKLSNITSFESQEEKDEAIKLANDIKRNASREDKNYYDTLIKRLEKIVPKTTATAKKAKTNTETKDKINAYNTAYSNYVKYYDAGSSIEKPIVIDVDASKKTQRITAKGAIATAYSNLPKDYQKKAVVDAGEYKYYVKINDDGSK